MVFLCQKNKIEINGGNIMSSLDYFNEIAESWNVIRSEYFEERLKYKVLSKTRYKR